MFLKCLKLSFIKIGYMWLNTDVTPRNVAILLVLLILCNSPEEVGVFVVIAGYGALCPVTDDHCAEVLGYPSNGFNGVRTCGA